MKDSVKNVFWIAGENSGDLHSSIVIKKLKEKGTNYNHIGIGGYRMQEYGFKPLFPFSKFSQMGFLEVISKIPFYLKVESGIKKIFSRLKPDIVVLVDYPGFNLRIARIAYEMNIPVIYYICPQFWAWRHSRVSRLSSDTNIVACILPFEKELLEINRVHASYVGHPIAEEISYEVDRATFARTFGLNPDKKWLGFMPGSRDSEIIKIMPSLIDAIRRFNTEEYEILVSKSHSVNNDLFWKFIPNERNLHISIIDGYIYEMIKYCHFITVTSGTAALEVAYICTPSIIIYKTSRISFEIAKRLIRVDKIGLPNIILEEKIIPEIIQNEVTGKNIYNNIREFLTNKTKYDEQKNKLKQLKSLLSEKSASGEVAELIERYIK